MRLVCLSACKNTRHETSYLFVGVHASVCVCVSMRAGVHACMWMYARRQVIAHLHMYVCNIIWNQ